jgi:hypothetical protein
MAQQQFKEEVQRFVADLLNRVEQLDGPDKKNEVKNSIEAGKVLGRIAAVVRELTSQYDPDHADKWEEIIRTANVLKTDEARSAHGMANVPRQAVCFFLHGAAPRPQRQRGRIVLCAD